MSTKTADQIADELLQRKIDEQVEKNPKIIIRPVNKMAKIDPKIKSAAIKDKFYYDVKVECMLPATVTYRILAEDAQQAAELIKGSSPIGVKHRLFGKKDLKLSVYKAGSSMLEWARNLVGA